MWLPSASEANWQNTRWDMSLEELLAARENLERTTPLEQRGETIEILGTPLAKGEYSTQQYGFKVTAVRQLVEQVQLGRSFSAQILQGPVIQ